jgi:hypothetical protein
MIGHYLLTLTPEQEGRVLTSKMAGYGLNQYDWQREKCLVQAVHPHLSAVRAMLGTSRNGFVVGHRTCVAKCYDWLCERFGNERVNRAIRNRVLSNQARRALRNAPQLSAVTVG